MTIPPLRILIFVSLVGCCYFVIPSQWLEKISSTTKLQSTENKSQMLHSQKAQGKKPLLSQPSNTDAGQKNNLQTSFGRFQTGDYEGALRELRGELKLSPGNGLVIQNISHTLLALGLLRIQQKNIADAIKYLEESAAFGNADAKLTLAKLNVRSGEIDAGTELFSDLLREKPSNDVYSMVADVFLRFDDLNKASSVLQQWERFLERQPLEEMSLERKTIVQEQLDVRKKKLALKQSILEKGFQVSSAQGIEIYFESETERAFAEKLLVLGESTLEKLEIPLGKSKKPLRVSLGQKETLFEANSTPHWAAAFFDGIVRLPVTANRNQMETHFKHELSHAYFFSHCGDVFPTWLSEGMAQLMENKIPSNVETYLKIKLGKRAFESHELLDSTFAGADSANASVLYEQSFLLVQKLSLQEQKWQTLLQEICLQLAPPGEVLFRQYGAATAKELFPLFFVSDPKR